MPENQKKRKYHFLKKFFLHILLTGTAKSSGSETRNIAITNLISILLFLIAISLAIRHWKDTTYCVLVIIVGLFFLTPLFFNRANLTLASRWLVSSIPPLFIVTLSVLNKKLYPETIHIINYLDVRFFLIGCLVIPVLVVPSDKKRLLISTISVSGILLVALDLILDTFNVGFYDLVNNYDPYYFSANFYSITTYAFILFSLLFAKNLSDKALHENEVLISFLHKANRELEDQKKEISSQKNEITAQAEELIANQDQLLRANALIEQQKERLLVIQFGLQTELVERNKELTQTNEELVRYNNELQQFSYTISHNLRGPLARLLGLTNLMEKDLSELTGAQLELVRLVGQSARELDEVIRDLGKIIDIRNDIYRIREKVFFQEEWSMVLRSLSTFIQPDMHIETDFRNAPLVYTVRPILTSILYNLASNAIKYRSPQRMLHVMVATKRVNNAVVLEVSDNGLGMNLEQFSRNMFGLYKRFHTHMEGKGLGLYLVKLQIESLGGTVDVESKLNVGSTFRVTFSDPIEVDGQIIFESDFGSIFYNARNNGAGIVWKKQVTSEQYRLLFSKCLEMVRLYHTPIWISDLTRQGTILKEDQQWMVTTIFPEAVRQGLRRVANIYSEEQHNEDYRARIKETALKLGAVIEFFTSRKQADEWAENSADLLKVPTTQK